MATNVALSLLGFKILALADPSTIYDPVLVKVLK
jgi:hypothetical protein